MEEELNKGSKKDIALILIAVIIGLVLLLSYSPIDMSYIVNDLLQVNSTNLPIEDNGAVPVNVQDQTSPAFDVFFTQDDETSFTVLLDQGLINSYEINISNVTPYSIGDYIGIFESESLFSGTILSISGNTIGLDTPLDNNFSTSAVVGITDREINADGSIDRQIYGIALPGTANISVDVTRILFKMICVNPPEFSDFCDIDGGLTRGLVLRRTDGVNQNYFNVKTNGELANLMYDLTFYDQSKQQGVNGIVGRMTFGGQSKHGVVIRLNPGDSLDLINQDDLTSLLSFRVIAEGHVVTD